MPENARAAAEGAGVPVRPFADLLADPDITSVVLATPDETHAELARAALDAGKHVLVEKPMATDADDAADLCARAESGGRVLMCGHILHYHPAFRELASLAGGGRFGRIRHIAAKRLHAAPGRPRHALWDLAPHDVSMVLAITGRMPIRVTAQQAAPIAGAPPQLAQVMLEFGDGLTADIALSEIHPVKLHQFTVTGEAGAAVFEDSRPWPEKLVLHSPLTPTGVATPMDPRPVVVAENEPLKAEVTAFLAAIAGGAAPPSDGREGQAVVTVVAAAVTAATTNEPVVLDTDARAVLETVRVRIA
jgi:UDP-2-acetamido-3-amino-2,3-dideoxy-glucuronate N-acetyltransferase